MSLATLKSKIELLIHKSTFGNIYEKIFKNEPLDLVIPDSVTVLCADQNIMYAPLTTITASGQDVEEITENFFMTTEVKSVDFPNLKIINNEVFYQCSALTELNIPLVTSIGDNAFYQCSALTELNIPLVTSIGDNAINGTSKLTKMTVGALENADPTSFKQVPRGSNGTLAELYVGVGTSADLYLQYSTQYTQEILHGIIENLYDLSNGGKTGILCVGAKNLEKIDDEHKAMAENKNWELS